MELQVGEEQSKIDRVPSSSSACRLLTPPQPSSPCPGIMNLMCYIALLVACIPCWMGACAGGLALAQNTIRDVGAESAQLHGSQGRGRLGRQEGRLGPHKLTSIKHNGTITTPRCVPHASVDALQLVTVPSVRSHCRALRA